MAKVTPLMAARKLFGFSQWFLLLAALLPHLLEAQTTVTLRTSGVAQAPAP